MPRTARAFAANTCYHVLNRGNNRNTVFHKDGDYGAFLKLINQANDRVNMRGQIKGDSQIEGEPNKRGRSSLIER